MLDNLRATSLVLRKQHLVPLTFGSKPSDVPRIADSVCGLQCDSAEKENPDWVLRNRFTDYKADWLQQSIKDRTLVEFRLMRASPYLVPPNELPYYFAATRDVVKKIAYGYFNLPFPNGIGDNENKVLDSLRKQAPATKSEIARRTKLSKHQLWEAMFNLDNLGHIVRVGLKGSQNLWHLMDEWLTDLKLGAVAKEEGEEYLTMKFFRAAGPSTKQCLSLWTGWSLETTTKNLDKLSKEKKLVELSSGHPESLIALHSDINEIDSYVERDTTVRFLSPFDPYLWMRKPLLWLGDFSPTNVGIYSVVIGGIIAASFRVARTKDSFSVANAKMFQKSLLSSRSAEVKREMEMHAASTNRTVKLSSEVKELF